MKRSEMLEKIYQKLSQCEFCDSYLSDWFNDEFIRYICELFLNTVEDVGMLPPKTDWLDLDEMNAIFGKDGWDETSSRKGLNVWESENE